MTILEQINTFQEQYRKEIEVDERAWRYYRLGSGSPILWLTGGLRRAAFGFAFLEKLAEKHTVIAPDYPPVRRIEEFNTAFDTILAAENTSRFTLGGQSYGGILAQAYLAHWPAAVERIILASSGPADTGRSWLAGLNLSVFLARILPEKTVKNLLIGRLVKLITVQEAERAGWLEAFDYFLQEELTRADVVSHFGVVADLVRSGMITPAAYRGWPGSVTVLSSANDPTQNQKDFPRYEKLFGKPVRVISTENMGHTAALLNPGLFVEMLESAFVS